MCVESLEYDIYCTALLGLFPTNPFYTHRQTAPRVLVSAPPVLVSVPPVLVSAPPVLIPYTQQKSALTIISGASWWITKAQDSVGDLSWLAKSSELP